MMAMEKGDSSSEGPETRRKKRRTHDGHGEGRFLVGGPRDAPEEAPHAAPRRLPGPPRARPGPQAPGPRLAADPAAPARALRGGRAGGAGDAGGAVSAPGAALH